MYLLLLMEYEQLEPLMGSVALTRCKREWSDRIRQHENKTMPMNYHRARAERRDQAKWNRVRSSAANLKHFFRDRNA